MKKYKMLAGGVVLSCVITGVFFLGDYFGYSYGMQKAFQILRDAVHKADYPGVYLTYPGKQPAAMIKDGICIPYPDPARVPKFYDFLGYVSPRWVPCASQKYNKPAGVSPALAAIESHVK